MTDEGNKPDGCTMQAENASNRGPSPVTIPRHAWQMARRQAARYVDEVRDKLQQCERERDDLVRRLAVVQERCDNLRSEHGYLTAHVRNLENEVCL